MPDIPHAVGIGASARSVYDALSTLNGLAGWWTTDTQGGTDLGESIIFRFGEDHIEMKVIENKPNSKIVWQVVEGPLEWIGTKVLFEIEQVDDFTALLFEHQNWKTPSKSMHHCSTKWATFLLSLKSLLETGKGRPYPDDVHISMTGD